MIDIRKQYKTRDGRSVHILSDMGSEAFPIVGLIEGEDTAQCWTIDGHYYQNDATASCSKDLIEETSEVRYYNYHAGQGAATLREAVEAAGRKSLGQIKVTVDAGKLVAAEVIPRI